MSDTMRVQPFEVLLRWILGELEQNQSIFGIHRSLFFSPAKDNRLATENLFGNRLATPIGPAAGPHTQLAQNIVSAWLTGGRFIELKTVQVMDELEIPRPCIDMEDEGYNVEWSQELKLRQSASEYIHAWALIHVLRRALGFDPEIPFGTVFNMSVGYNLEGIQSTPMQRFMDRMEDASAEIAEIRAVLRTHFPQFRDVEIPSRLTNSVTLSTMHGCPPDEIERIARFLLEERGLHTTVKLNPTLMGKEGVLGILHGKLGYHEIVIPDAVFDHDLSYARAVELIRALKGTAAKRGLTFGVKLSNTLAMANHRGVLPGGEVYMSGRALYPITVNLFHRLVEEFDGDLNVSYAGGADALNVSTLVAAGALPVTAASDLLKPGGYGRFGQWLDELGNTMRDRGAGTLAELARNRRQNLAQAANEALKDRRYKKSAFPHGLPKVESPLALFDCVAAPCVEQCAVCQDVPEYAWLIAQGEYSRALEVILHRNPLPGATGYACTHLCQTRCTRNNYDEAVAIRNLKRFAFENGRADYEARSLGHPGEAHDPLDGTGPRVAVVGSGPSGLAAAYFLARNGVRVTVFEAREMPGGMLAIAPDFRLPEAVVNEDIRRIEALGVEIKVNHRVSEPPEELLRDGFDAVYVACGLERDATLELEGKNGQGILTALRFLEQVVRGRAPDLGSQVLVVGGGNTAMDAARTAQRLAGRPVTVVYRRTRAEMPAEEEELRDLFDEGNRLIELASPTRYLLRHGRLVALECVRNELGPPGADGRRSPVPIPGSEFRIEADTVILAIGQKPDLAFLEGVVALRRDGRIDADEATTLVSDRVYAGGDVTRGPAIIIQACLDGRRAAEAICQRMGLPFELPPFRPARLSPHDVVQVKGARTRKVGRHEPELLPAGERGGFDLVEKTLTEAAAQSEALRCLQCSTLCDKCVEVCPNRANYAVQVTPVELHLPLLACQNGRLAIVGHEAFRVHQARQIVHVDDFCNECGNCSTFCVHQGRPFADKPRLFLQEGDFRREVDNAYYVNSGSIRRRDGGWESELCLCDGGLTYSDGRVRLDLTYDFQIEAMETSGPFDGAYSLRGAAEMAVILNALRDTARFLLR